MADHFGSIERTTDAPLISRRAYNALTFGLVTVSFLVTWGMYLFASSAAFYGLAQSVSPLVLLIGSLVGTIGGLVLMGVGKSRQSLGLSVGGYALFTLTFGLSLGLALSAYNVGTIYYAFGVTACLSGIFLLLGVMFPDFFASLGRILFAGLLALILIEVVSVVVFHANQTIFDYLAIALFCGYLGYDSLLMSADAPTVSNAIWHACDIYVDIANILVRVLSLLDRD